MSSNFFNFAKSPRISLRLIIGYPSMGQCRAWGSKKSDPPHMLSAQFELPTVTDTEAVVEFRFCEPLFVLFDLQSV